MSTLERCIVGACFAAGGILLFHLILFVPLSMGYKVSWIFPYEVGGIGLIGSLILGCLAYDVLKRN